MPKNKRVKKKMRISQNCNRNFLYVGRLKMPSKVTLRSAGFCRFFFKNTKKVSPDDIINTTIIDPKKTSQITPKLVQLIKQEKHMKTTTVFDPDFLETYQNDSKMKKNSKIVKICEEDFER